MLSHGPMHGWAIAQRLQAISRNVFQVGQGPISPAVRRLEAEGWVAADWRVSDGGRLARFYTLTPSGLRHLTRERATWRACSAAMARVLDLT